MSHDAVCIIPARGGSKRFPGKNLALLAGKPLLQHTIDAAVEAAVFDEVVVSSDATAVLELASDCGVVADRRPPALASDTARAVEVVAELLERRGDFARVAMMLPTCPLRTASDAREAMRTFEAADDEFLIGVTAYDFPPELALRVTGSRARMVDPAAYRASTRSQEWGEAMRPNGSIYLATTTAFLRERTFFVDPCAVHVMPPERSIDIDYPYQLAVAEATFASGVCER